MLNPELLCIAVEQFDILAFQAGIALEGIKKDLLFNTTATAQDVHDRALQPCNTQGIAMW